MLDIALFREPEALAVVRASQEMRGKHLDAVDKVVELDRKWKDARFTTDSLNRCNNLFGKVIGPKKKAKEPEGDTDEIPAEFMAMLDEPSKMSIETLTPLTVRQLKSLKIAVEKKNKTIKEKLVEIEEERTKELLRIGNLVPTDRNVPAGMDEDAGNRVERSHAAGGDTELPRKKYSHVDLLHMIGGADYKRGSSVSGNRGYFLTGPGVFLEQAIMQFAMHFAYKKGYTPIYTPFFMNKNVMQEVAQLSDFDEMLYKVTAKSSEQEGDNSTEEKYLIATSEQPLCALHRDEWLAKDSLPKRYVGTSTCFRQEVGSHGRDTGGIFRVHQFEKIEQFCIASPEGKKSWELFEEMIGNAEEFYKELGFSYRVVNIVAGALNNAAAQKFDLEAWFPGSKAYRELVSCSNCTDYQSRRLKIRFGETKVDKAEYVHLLNSTLAALTRVICCLLETYQTDDGIVIPECLIKFFPPGYPSVIPFVNEALVDAVPSGSKAKGKQQKK